MLLLLLLLLLLVVVPVVVAVVVVLKLLLGDRAAGCVVYPDSISIWSTTRAAAPLSLK